MPSLRRPRSARRLQTIRRGNWNRSQHIYVDPPTQCAESSDQACAVLEGAAKTGGPLTRLLEVAAQRAWRTEDSVLAQLVLSLQPKHGLSSAAAAALLQQRADAVRREIVLTGDAPAYAAVDACILELFVTNFSRIDISSHPLAYDLVLNAATRVGDYAVVDALVGPPKRCLAPIRSARSGADVRQVAGSERSRLERCL